MTQTLLIQICRCWFSFWLTGHYICLAKLVISSSSNCSLVYITTHTYLKLVKDKSESFNSFKLIEWNTLNTEPKSVSESISGSAELRICYLLLSYPLFCFVLDVEILFEVSNIISLARSIKWHICQNTNLFDIWGQQIKNSTFIV